MSLARRTVSSISWNVSVSFVEVAVGLVRSVLLARWLAVATFGVYGLASSIVSLTAVFAGFGLTDAFLHRGPETEDEGQAATVFLTLQLILSAAWAALLILGAVVFTSGQLRTALLVLTVTQFGRFLTQIPRAILVRRVVHRRLALLQLNRVLLGSSVALLLAWRGVELGALLAVNIITLIINTIFLYVWRPVWRPRLTWAPPMMRYFLAFGGRNVLAAILLQAQDRLDDLWTGVRLGAPALGYYSRAYTFATYPRLVLATSVNSVVMGTYAELKTNRMRLSQAFFRTNAFLVRSGFFLAGLLALVAPEFIRLVLSAKWLPMLEAFRLMLVFTMLDPVKLSISNLFIAVGRPDQVVRTRAVQLVVLVIALILFGPALGIAGVALAADIMLLTGIAIMFLQARSHVDFSLRRLLAVPILSLILGMLLAHSAIILPGVLGSDWRTAFVKALVFSVVYGTILLTLERKQLIRIISFVADVGFRST